MHGNRTLTSIQSLSLASIYDIYIYSALINAGWGAKRAHMHSAYAARFPWRPLRQLPIPRLRIALRNYAIDSVTYNPPTRQGARGADAPFNGVRAHPTYKGYETGGN